MGAVGFQSRTIDHTYDEKDQGTFRDPINLKMPVHLELCLTCYRKDQIKNGEDPLFDRPYGALELDRLDELPAHPKVISHKFGKLPSPPPVDPKSFPKEDRRQIAEESNSVPLRPNLADLYFEIQT